MLKPQYLAEGVALKATVATGGTAAMVLERFCGNQPLLCALASDFSLILFLLGMMALDMITGVVASRSEGNRINSRRLGEGIYRKVAMVTVIMGAFLVGGVMEQSGFPIQDLIYRWVTSWFIGVEALSLYENASRTGLRMPTGLKALIEKMLQGADQKLEKARDGIKPGSS